MVLTTCTLFESEPLFLILWALILCLRLQVQDEKQRGQESAISEVHLHPLALWKAFSSSAYTFYPFLLNFASNSVVFYKDIQRSFITSSIAKPAKLHYIKIFFLLTPSLVDSLCASHFSSLYNLENPQVSGGAIANAARVRFTNSSHVASSSKWNQSRNTMHGLSRAKNVLHRWA